jgi:hypothetical protein
VSAGLMSALGQKQTCAAHNPMSAVPIDGVIGRAIFVDS